MRTLVVMSCLVWITLSYGLADDWSANQLKTKVDPIWGPGIAPGDYFSSRPIDFLKAGNYEESSLATKVRLNYLAFADPERLRDVNLIYGYDLAFLCKAGATLSNAALIPGDSHSKAVRLDDEALVAQTFSCAESGRADVGLTGVFVFSSQRVPDITAKQFISLRTSGLITPDYGTVTIGGAGLVTLTTGMFTETYSTDAFIQTLRATPRR